jgi:soluble lytic murein transglycosylase-like protein
MKSKTAKGIRIGLLFSLVLSFIFGTSTVGGYTTPGLVFPKMQVMMYDTTEYALTKYINKINKDISKEDTLQIVKSTMQWSKEFNVDPALLVAIQQTESKFDKYAISSAGAFGVMQVIPKWHLDKLQQAKKETGSPELFNIHTNIYLGTKVLKECLKQFNLQRNALLCYNGSNANPNGYDEKVMAAYRSIRENIRGFNG